MSRADLFSLVGLLIYCSIASLGLFINSGFSEPLLLLWLAGYLSLALTVSYRAYVSPGRLNRFAFLVLGVIALNLFVQVSGGITSRLWAAYFLYAVLVAALFPPRWAFATTGLILLIETANLIVPKQGGDLRWDAYIGFALTLAGVTAAASYLLHRFRREAKQMREAHERLLAHASAVDPLADDTKLTALTRENRNAANVSAAIEREDAFQALIEMIYGFVPAHTYVLYLMERRNGRDVLVLRAVRSSSSFVRKPGTALGPEAERGIIALCAERRQEQYLPELVISPLNLGYYLRDVPVRSFFALPIVSGSGAMGVLAMDSLEQDAFAPDMRDMISHFAPFFVQIIQKIRLSQDLDVRAASFAALHELSSVLNSSLQLDEILGRLSDQLRTMVPHDLCVFVQYDVKENEAVIVHQSGALAVVPEATSVFSRMTSAMRSIFRTAGDEQAEQRFPVGQSAILGQMLKQWEQGRVTAYHFADLGERGQDMGLFGEAARLDQQLRSLSCWPLAAREKFIGAFFLASRIPDGFSEFHLHVLDTLMNQLSVVMDNVILHQQVRDMALTDGLTGLLNHRTFMERLTDEFSRLDREPAPFSILLMDIDFFKKVNDTYGHPVGDVALKTVAGVIRRSVRNIDFVARYGGEEFAVGLVGADGTGADQMAERIRKAVEMTPVVAGRHTFPCTLSIGTATLVLGREKKEDVIGRADAALYHAKRSGRNRVSRSEKLTPADLQAVEKPAGHPAAGGR